MDLTGVNSIQGYIFDGSYSSGIIPFDTGLSGFWADNNINPTGMTGGLVYYQPGNLLTDSGRLITGFGINQGIASGLSATPSDISGYVYYRINALIYGTCHGVGSDTNVWYSGFNFYNAFHQEGYFAPPFGQNLSIYLQNNDGYSALAEDGSCSSLTIQEYNDLFGICTQLDDNIDSSSDDATTFINSPSIACPQDISVTFYWHEVQYKLIAGTAGAIAGNTFFNSNPIPSSLDNFYVKTPQRYLTVSSGITGVDSTPASQYLNIVQYSGGKPLPNYITTKGNNILNNLTCPGVLAEGSLEGQIVESQLLDDPDDIDNESDANFDSNNWWHLWHFLYKENTDGFPFSNSYENGGNNFGVAGTSNQENQGSELFESMLSDSDEYWNRRQCPEVISFLPHTFGGAILACPSYYFDIPYYAAIKKFGFYGTRFLNGCVSLEMSYPQSGQVGTENLDLPYTGYSYITPGDSEPEPDLGTNGTFTNYNNLLRIAASEELQTDFYALNKTLFLWANSGLITGSMQYQSLTGNSGFVAAFNNTFSQYVSAFSGGTGDLLNLNNKLFESGSIFYDTGSIYGFLSNNDLYVNYRNNILKTFTGQNDSINWQYIEDNYGVAILQSLGNVASDFYHQLGTGKQQRLQTRYLENYINGNPIDLYPTNKIYFSYDQAAGFINGSGWGKSPFGGYGTNSNFSDSGLTRRFFLGAYGNGQDIISFQDFVNTSNNINLNGTSFYPGYFDSDIPSEFPIPSYTPIITGWSGSGGGYSPISGNWLSIGYNGIGQLSNNFSCFTPIFIQQPFSTTYCKIGQSPTFRSYAVDYHTIPEDKINIRYPEIIYWTTKLKMVDSNYNNLYPLSYKWYRILKSDCTGSIPNSGFQNFLLNPDFTLLEPSNSTGNWCALEGDGPNCTLIHPNECVPKFIQNNQWSYEFINTTAYKTAQQNNFYMTFKQGAIRGTDDLYYYFCMVRGRFGIRISEPSELFIENWLSFDLSVQNGGNISMTPPTVTFAGNLTGVTQQISCTSTSMVAYDGFQRSNDFIPEDVIQEKIPPPNAGYGDVYSWTFVGMWGYGGATQTYSPGTLSDTRGLNETWGRLLHYGNLKQYYTTLTQTQGNFLYGTSHLPVCTLGINGYSMPVGQQGISVSVNGIVHLDNIQSPITNTNGNQGVKYDQLENAGALYPPINLRQNNIVISASPGLGQWQWGNNLGTIHNFGWNSNIILDGQIPTSQNIDNGDISSTPDQLTPAQLAQIKKLYLGDGVLGGKNCGWQKYGLGRNMLYWIEGFNAFYLYCDSLKKKNVQNLNYMNPGLRQSNSSIQYFWLGKPNNSYLERYPLFGPYAYEWKVRQHNRDRNGNGISEGFYSYGWNSNYTQQYDAPAIYGLFIKYQNRSDSQTLSSLQAGRSTVFGTNLQSVKTTSFGFIADEGQEGILYGDIFLGVLPGNTNPTALYVGSGESNASSQKVELFGCSDDDLAAGKCFDPCLSMRYQFGFLPGGKQQLFTTSFPNGEGYNLVPNSLVKNNIPADSTVTGAAGVYFRGAWGTPHLNYLESALVSAGHSFTSQELNGFSPCFDGGADHCNYITPTLNIGTSMYFEKSVSALISNADLASQSVDI